MTEPDPAKYPWWLASRSAGIVAFLLIASAVILGLLLASRLSWPPGMKRSLVRVHQQIALAALAAIGVHGALLLGDGFLHPGVTGIPIPFTLAYRPLWTGLGILAGYLALVLGPTYYLRRRIGARRWRRIHQATVLVYMLALMHSLGAGTDGASLWFRVLAAGSAATIAALLVVRYGQRGRRSARARVRPRPTVATGPTPGAHASR
jgi:sulfoxide reductase heme-binding subunit YedZ